MSHFQDVSTIVLDRLSCFRYNVGNKNRTRGNSMTNDLFGDATVKELSKPIDPSRVKVRDGGGRSLSYIEGYDVINTANRIFGFGAWTFEVSDVSYNGAGVYMARGRVRVGQVVREDVGVGLVVRDSGEGHEVAIKGAVTDLLKRCFRTFGAAFGNDLYDKDNPIHQQVQQQQNGQRDAGGGVRSATPSQLNFLQRLAKAKGVALDDWLATAGFPPSGRLTMADASAAIEQLRG